MERSQSSRDEFIADDQEMLPRDNEAHDAPTLVRKRGRPRKGEIREKLPPVSEGEMRVTRSRAKEAQERVEQQQQQQHTEESVYPPADQRITRAMAHLQQMRDLQTFSVNAVKRYITRAHNVAAQVWEKLIKKYPHLSHGYTHTYGPPMECDEYGLPKQKLRDIKDQKWVHKRRVFLQRLSPQHRNILLTGDPLFSFDPLVYEIAILFPPGQLANLPAPLPNFNYFNLLPFADIDFEINDNNQAHAQAQGGGAIPRNTGYRLNRPVGDFRNWRDNVRSPHVTGTNKSSSSDDEVTFPYQEPVQAKWGEELKNRLAHMRLRPTVKNLKKSRITPTPPPPVPPTTPTKSMASPQPSSSGAGILAAPRFVPQSNPAITTMRTPPRPPGGHLVRTFGRNLPMVSNLPAPSQAPMPSWRNPGQPQSPPQTLMSQSYPPPTTPPRLRGPPIVGLSHFMPGPVFQPRTRPFIGPNSPSPPRPRHQLAHPRPPQPSTNQQQPNAQRMNPWREWLHDWTNM